VKENMKKLAFIIYLTSVLLSEKWSLISCFDKLDARSMESQSVEAETERLFQNREIFHAMIYLQILCK